MYGNQKRRYSIGIMLIIHVSEYYDVTQSQDLFDGLIKNVLPSAPELGDWENADDDGLALKLEIGEIWEKKPAHVPHDLGRIVTAITAYILSYSRFSYTWITGHRIETYVSPLQENKYINPEIEELMKKEEGLV